MKRFLYSLFIFFALASTAFGAARNLRWIPQTNDLILIETGSTGNVGVASTTPARPFSVEGDTLLTGQLKVGSIFATSTVKFGSITGSTQCLHVDTNGTVSGTGSDCGSGVGGGGSDGNLTITTINSQKYLTPTSTNYNFLLNNTNGLIANGSSTFGSTLKVDGVFNASSTVHISSTLTSPKIISSTLFATSSPFRFDSQVASGIFRFEDDIQDSSKRSVSNGPYVMLASTTAAGDATTFAAALALLPSGGGSISVGCGNFSIAANAGGIDRNFVEIIGQGQCTEFQFNQATQGVGFFNSDPSTQRTSIRMKNFHIKQTGTTGNGTCLDFSGFVYADIENVNCTGANIGMIASTTNTFYNTISEGWVNISGTNSVGYWVSNSSNDNTFQNVKAITSSASKGFYIDAHSTHCFACTVEADAVIGMHIDDDGDDATIHGVYLEGNAINLQVENGAEAVDVTGFIADADDTATGNIVNNGACGLVVNARVQYSTTRGNYTTSEGCTGENALFQGFGSSTPWGLFSIDQDPNHSRLKPVFVVADNGTTTPFLFVNQKGGVALGVASTSPLAGSLHSSGRIYAGGTLSTGGILKVLGTGTSTFAGSNTFSVANTKCIICVTAGAGIGTANAAVGEGALIVDNTLNTQSPGLYVSSDQAGVPDNPLAIFRSSSTSYNQGLLWLLGATGNSGGAAYGIKITDDNPDVEFDETNQTSPAGDYEIDVNNDFFRFNGRDAGNSSFDTIFTLQRRDQGAAGQGGRACLGCVFSTPTGGLLDIVGTTTPGEDYLTLSTSVGAGNILTVNRNGRLGVGTSSPARLFSVDGDALITGALKTGPITGTSTLSITGLSSLAGINASGVFNASTTAHITGATTLGNTLTVQGTGTSTFSGGLDISSVGQFAVGLSATNNTVFKQISAGNLRISSTGDININSLGDDFILNDRMRLNITSATAFDVDGAVQAFMVDTTNGRAGSGATNTPWGTLAVEQSPGETPLKPLFVVGDSGTTTPFVFVNQKGIFGVGTSTLTGGRAAWPEFGIQASTGTTTLHIGQSTTANRGSCVQMYDGNKVAYRIFINAAGNDVSVEAGVCE